ncbi:MAG: hypothetical protein AAGA55_09810 [Planctomycetota bacterium]
MKRFGVVTGLSSVAVVLFAVLVVPVQRARYSTPQLRATVQIRSVMQAMTVWATQADAGFPDELTWRADLIGARLIGHDMLGSEGAGVDPVYFYIRPTADQLRAMRENGATAVVVLYENPAMWRGVGGHVAYLDGRVEWVERDDYPDLIGRPTRDGVGG